MTQRPLVVLLILFLVGSLAACSRDTKPQGEPLRILSGSENRTLEPLLTRFTKNEKIPVEMTYKGSVDIMLEIEQGAGIAYDAVWPASSVWIALGDRQSVVKSQESIFRSPVVFGVKKSVAERLGWAGRDVKVDEILTAAESGQFRFMMTSATQSNSGASAYFGFLNSFAGSPEVLTGANLQDPRVREQVTRILGTVNRSAGSSGWLKDLFLQRYDVFDAMVNYEAVVIEANQELEKTRREPLYAIYPVDGLSLADSPLGYVNKGDTKKEDQYQKLRRFLLSDEAQKEILGTGRRTGPLGVNPAGANPQVFRKDWSIDTGRVLTTIKFPAPDVIQQALILYQTAFRKPSLTVFCLDFSGSMSGKGDDDLKSAMRTLLDPQVAGRYLLQAAPQDITIVIPFSDRLKNTWEVKGNDPNALRDLLGKITTQRAEGGTNIYAPVQRAMALIKERGYENYSTAVILMTDGRSNVGTFADLQGDVNRLGTGDVPVYSILFGEASRDQLQQIADLTTGRIFDGRTDLIAAFREAKGYN